ncbi:MAG: SpoIIE family protein phosphatase [Gemmatimonadota bacterium]|nr:SpoIIE family protein phosphatase [Gemmatimonadota bacterium]MDH5759137.1 SpoIIE family protein phosphatase [Gemmatimonadota bacterium]
MDMGWFSRPCRGERANGDAVVIEANDGLHLFAVLDGLGHGEAAAEVADRAVGFLSDRWSGQPAHDMAMLHDHLLGTRGLAAGLAVFQQETGRLSYSAVGNTAFHIMGTIQRKLPAQPGTVGQRLTRVNEYSVDLASGMVVIMTTDGVSSRISQDDCRSTLVHTPTTMARTIVRRFGKPMDDATCLVVKV